MALEKIDSILEPLKVGEHKPLSNAHLNYSDIDTPSAIRAFNAIRKYEQSNNVTLEEVLKDDIIRHKVSVRGEEKEVDLLE